MSLNSQVREKIQGLITSDEVVLFMKGNRNFPQCGFSATVVQILNNLVPSYTTVNVLAEPDVRQGIKEFSEWPTIPQLYIRGEFVGGCDIIRSMYEAGELHTMLGAAAPKPPAIELTPAAAEALTGALAEAEAGDVIHLAIDASFNHQLNVGPKDSSAMLVESRGVPLCVEAMSGQRADGLVIDFVDGPQGTGFKMKNPNAPLGVEELEPTAMQAKLTAGELAELFDVRTPAERQSARIEPSRLLDEAAMEHLGNLDRNTPIGFYCHHGARSRAAAEHFAEQGFRRVYNLAGGIDRWSQEIDPSVPRY